MSWLPPLGHGPAVTERCAIQEGSSILPKTYGSGWFTRPNVKPVDTETPDGCSNLAFTAHLLLRLSWNGCVLNVFLGAGTARAGFIHWFRIVPAPGLILRVMGIRLILWNLRDD